MDRVRELRQDPGQLRERARVRHGAPSEPRRDAPQGGSSPAGAPEAFFRHDKGLHGEISGLVYRLVRDFAAEAAGKPLRTAAVVVFQTAGAFCRRRSGPAWGWNAHWHGLFLEGASTRRAASSTSHGRQQGESHAGSPKVDLQMMSRCQSDQGT